MKRNKENPEEEMSGDKEKHDITSMIANGHQQNLWSLNGDVEEIQLYETQYPISEWDQNLGLDYKFREKLRISYL